jgi:ketosteroid isomerase-like protein
MSEGGERDVTGDHDRIAANKSLVRRWFSALSELRFADAWALDDPNGFLWVPALRRTMPLRDWHIAYERLMEQQFPDGGVQFEIGPMTAQGDRVSVLTEGRGTLPSGVAYHNFYHWLFEADGSRITGIYEYMDTHHAHVTTHAAGWRGPIQAARS